MSANHIALQGAGYEPQREFNFSFEMALKGVADEGIIRLSCLSAFLPEWSTEDIVLKHMNEERTVTGRVTYGEGELVCYDYFDKQTAENLYGWAETYYNPITGEIGLAATSKKEGVLVQYSPDGNKTRSWKLIGVRCKSWKWGEANHEGGDSCKITIGIKYDKGYPIFDVAGALAQNIQTPIQ